MAPGGPLIGSHLWFTGHLCHVITPFSCRVYSSVRIFPFVSGHICGNYKRIASGVGDEEEKLPSERLRVECTHDGFAVENFLEQICKQSCVPLWFFFPADYAKN